MDFGTLIVYGLTHEGLIDNTGGVSTGFRVTTTTKSGKVINSCLIGRVGYFEETDNDQDLISAWRGGVEYGELAMFGRLIGAVYYTGRWDVGQYANWSFEEFYWEKEIYPDNVVRYPYREIYHLVIHFVPFFKLSSDSGILDADEYGYTSDLKQIEVAHMPNKTSYKNGEAIDYAGLIVKGIHCDDTTEDVTDECVYSPKSGTVFTGDTTVLVSCQIKYKKYNPITHKYDLDVVGTYCSCTFELG